MGARARYTIASVVVIAWMGAVRAWMSWWGHDDDTLGAYLLGLVQGAVMVVVGWLLGRRSTARRDGIRVAESAYELLGPADRATVDEALARGVPQGRVALRSLERDMARIRLQDNPGRRSLVGWGAFFLALPVVLAAVAPSHPAWLVVVTALTLLGGVGAGALVTRSRPDPLSADERARLEQVVRTALR